MTNEKTKYGEYKVVGYYNSDLDFSDVSYVYTPYFPVEVLSDTQLKLVYENYIDSDGVYNKSNFESFDNFKKSYGSGSSSMMVISNNIDQTSNDILKACSYCSISSNKSERSRIIKSIKSRIIKTVILEIIVIIILYSFYVLNFKNINTLKRRSKIKLIIHNYDKNYIKKLLIYEMVIYLCTTSSILAIIYISLDIQYTFALVPSILFILISLLVSLFFDIKNLKSRKIMKLLNRK